MREELIQYVSLLFAGTENCEDIQQEILQNTLDRYDDLISQGNSPEKAYRKAIFGIGDVSEIITAEQSGQKDTHSFQTTTVQESDSPMKKMMRAIAIALYILCAIPLIILDTFGLGDIGVCLTLAIAAVATVLIILGKKESLNTKATENESGDFYHEDDTPKQGLRKSVKNLIWAVGFAIYLIVSFLTGAWYVTWVIFPIIGGVQGLVIACMDLVEGQ